MVDEAVLRIVLQDAAGGTPSKASGADSSAASAGPPSSTSGQPQSYISGRFAPRAGPGPFDPIAEAKRRREREEKLQAIDAAYQELYPTPQAQFDPVVEAQRLLDTHRRRIEVEKEYAKLNPPPPDPTAYDLALKRLEREKKREEIDAEYEKLNPTIPVLEPAFDPLEVAKKRVEREEQRAAADAEYAKLKPPAPFDPHEEARKRKEKQDKKEAIDAAFADMYPTSDSLDKLLATADKFRGIIGGFGGPLVGSAMDALSAFRKAGVFGGKGTPSAPGGGGSPPIPKGATPIAYGENVSEAEAAGLSEVTAAPEAGVLGSIGASAGPIGAVITAALAADSMIKGAVRGVVSSVGDLAAGIASANTDVSKPIGSFGEAVSKAGDKLGPFSYATIAAGESLKALSVVMQAIDQTASKYGEYNPEIASALAIAEVRQTLGDLRRSREAGPELVQYIKAEADLQQKVEDIKVQLLVRFLPVVTKMLEGIENMIEMTEKSYEIAKALQPLTSIADAIMELVGMQKDDRIPDVDDPTKIILGEQPLPRVPQL